MRRGLFSQAPQYLRLPQGSGEDIIIQLLRNLDHFLRHAVLPPTIEDLRRI
jgi:hypothetical protein